MAHAEEETAFDVLPILTESRLRSVSEFVGVGVGVWVCALRMFEAEVKYSLAHLRVLLYFLRVMSFHVYMKMYYGIMVRSSSKSWFGVKY